MFTFMTCVLACYPKRFSAMSSMQSEMEQLFGAPTKRFANTKAYKQILSSYHFRIKCLRSDLQVPCRKLFVNVLNETA